MPHPNAPLSYDASKHVLQHMDPNQRVLLVTKCPSLKTRDSTVPQRIESVCVEKARITINNTSYKIGVIRQYPQGAAIPKDIAEYNSRGGMHWDVDRFGIRILSQEVLPGEFPLHLMTPRTAEETRRYCENMIKLLKRKLIRKKKERRNMRIRRNSEEPPGNIAELEEQDKAIAEVEADILPYQLRLDNNDKDLPFTLFLQLTISVDGPDGPKVLAIERFQYNQNLGPAMQYLLGRFLKKPMNYVNELRIMSSLVTDRFWLPAELNLTARHLRINTYSVSVLRTVGLFLHRNNQRPFKTIAFEPIHYVNYDVNIANAAETLIIIEINPGFPIHTIRNRRVHFEACLKFIQLIPLIEYWERNGAPIGTYFTADLTPREGDVWYLLMRCRGAHTVAETPTRGSKCFPNCLIFPLAYNVQLEFYITSTENCPHPSQLNLEVQPRN